MSYYGVRKLKVVKNSENKFNVSCDYYDSSLRDYKGNRIWEHSDHFFAKDFDTKEELEYYLFQDVLDGDLKGVGGKFACIAWGNCKVEPSKEELLKYDELYKEAATASKYFWNEFTKQDKFHGKTHKECYDLFDDYKQAWDSVMLKEENKRNYRYSIYYKAWKEYLQEQKDTKKDKGRFIVKIDYLNYKDIYIGSFSKVRTSFVYEECYAKVFVKTLEEMKDLFLNERDTRNKKYDKITLIDTINKDKIQIK